MNLIIYTTNFIPFISGVTNRIKIFLDMNIIYKKFDKIFILTADQNAINEYKTYKVIKLPSLNLPYIVDHNIHNNIFYANFSNKIIKKIIEDIIIKEDLSHMHVYQGDFINIYLTLLANKYNIKTLYSWHTDLFKTLDITNMIKISSLISSLCYKFLCLKNMDIYTVIEGHAASAATLISIVGKKRYMTKHSYMLIHQGSTWLSGWINKWQWDDENKNFTKLENDLNKLYHKYCRLNSKEKKKKLKNILVHDLWLDYKKCKDFGLVDDYYNNVGEFYRL